MFVAFTVINVCVNVHCVCDKTTNTNIVCCITGAYNAQQIVLYLANQRGADAWHHGNIGGLHYFLTRYAEAADRVRVST